MRPPRALVVVLAAAGCAGPLAAPGFNLAPTAPVVQVAVATDRVLESVSRAWHPGDVFEFDLSLKTFDADQGKFVDLPTPRATVLPQQPATAPAVVAQFGGLAVGKRYQVSVVARGNAGGTAPDVVLNAAASATAVFDLMATAPVLQETVHVPLDPLPFAVALQLPSNLTAPGSVPDWATSLDATLAEAAASGTPLVRTTYLPGAAMRFANVKGDHPYALGLTIHSPTGQTTVRLPAYVVARTDGVPDTVVPVFPPFVPPTGTLLHSYTVAASSFGVALDPQDHVWVTIQHGDAVAEIDASGTALIPQVAVGSTPRGIAIDQATQAVWVAEASFSGEVNKIVNGVRVGHFSAGLVPGSVAIDPQHRAWVTDALLGQVHTLNPDGTEVAGSPYGVGSRPAAIAVDQVSGDVWVSNSSSNNVSKISAAGVVSGPFAAGTTPSGVAIAPDHTIWVSCNGDSTLRHYKPDGTAAGPNVSVPGGPSLLTIDQTTGDMWMAVLSGNLMAKVTPAGVLVGRYPAGTFPAGVAIDGHHNVWVTGNGIVTELAP